MILKPARMFMSIVLLAGIAAAASSMQLKPQAQGQGQAKTQKSTTQVSLPVQLTYGFDAGKVYHYKVDAIFSGQIPKLSEPGTDAHIKAELFYSATVLKHDAKGTNVAFAVEAENLSFLTKDPGPDGKLSPDDELPFPLPLAQIQSYLNVTALLRPDGSVAEVTGGSNDPIKINIGVDLRKMFVLMLPIVLPNHAVNPGQTWSFDEGFLGKKPGTTTYTGKIVGVREDSNRCIFALSQAAKASVSDHLDKEGNSTPDSKLQVGTITGDVSAEGSMDLAAPRNSHGDTVSRGSYAGRLLTGKMTVSVNLKRTMPDPDHPDKMIVDPITVRGRMFVQIQPGPPKSDVATPTTSSASVDASTSNSK